MAVRESVVERKTNETEVRLTLSLDGSGKIQGSSGVEFFDHMLALMARHALFDLSLTAVGDIGVDAHHTVEDAGICLGKALAKALGDKKGIRRYGCSLLPMDEALARVALDLSGRPRLMWRADIPAGKCGDFDTYLGKEFIQTFCVNGGINLHVDLLSDDNPHHALEAIFKGLGRSLRQAVSLDPREKDIPSTKGVL